MDPVTSKLDPAIDYRRGPLAVPAEAFVTLAQRVWPEPYDMARVAAALRTTLNVGAWAEGRLIGSVRVLSDGYLFSTVPEVMVDPEYQRRGIGRELMRLALEMAPGGRLFFGAQPGNEGFLNVRAFSVGPSGLWVVVPRRFIDGQ